MAALLLVLTLAVSLVYGQVGPLMEHRPLTVAQQRRIELRQDPELLEFAAKTGTRVVIEITNMDQTVLVQEGVNTNLDCFPWLSRFPGGTTEWYMQLIDDFGGPIGDFALQRRTPEDMIDQVDEVVGGEFNRWFNISSTIIVRGGEDPSFGNYICSVCVARGTAFEVCHNATTTLYIVGSPPLIDKATNNEREPLSTELAPIYKVGADFCIDLDFENQRVTVTCGVLEADVDNGRGGAEPPPNRTWTSDTGNSTERFFFETDDERNSDILPEFLINNPVYITGTIIPTLLEVFESGNIIFNTRVMEIDNVSLPFLPPIQERPNVAAAELRAAVTGEVLGTYTCLVNNIYGEDAAKSVIRVCGDPVMFPGCASSTIFIDEARASAPVGCNVCVAPGTPVSLNCSASGTPPVSYEWVDSMGNLLSRTAQVLVRREGTYTCNAVSADSPGGVSNTSTVIFNPFPSFTSQITDEGGEDLPDNGCGRLLEPPGGSPDLCVFLGETLNFQCLNSETNEVLNVTNPDGSPHNQSLSLRVENAGSTFNGTFLCRTADTTACGQIIVRMDVRVFDPARVNRVDATGGLGAGQFTEVQEVTEGGTVTLFCPVTGIGDPTIRWSRVVKDPASGATQEVPIDSEDSRLSEAAGMSLMLTITGYNQTRDGGTFICRTRNIAGEDAAIVAITSVADSAVWSASGFSDCNVNCADGVRVRSVTCRSSRDGRLLPSIMCPLPRPTSQMSCADLFPDRCFLTPIFFSGDFGPCSLGCSGGVRERDVYCFIPYSRAVVPDRDCFPLRKPNERDFCPNTCCVEDKYLACKRIGSSMCNIIQFQQDCCWTCLLREKP